MNNVTYVSNNTPKEIYLRSLNGEPIGLSLRSGSVTITGEWKKFLASSDLINIVSKLSKSIAYSLTNPIGPEVKAKPVINKLIADKSELTIVEGETANINFRLEPKDSELPTQIVSISEHINIASAEVKDLAAVIKAHKPGTSKIKFMTGNIECDVLVKSAIKPEFVKPYYEGFVGEPVVLAIKGQKSFTLTLPEGLTQEGNSVKAEKSGSYEVLCEVLGKTISTKVNFLDA